MKASGRSAGKDVGVGAVHERVADGQVVVERWGRFREVRPDALSGGDGEPEAGDGDSEGVQVDAVDRVKGLLHPGLGFHARCVPVPPVEQAVEGAEQEVSRPARRVDQLEAFEGPVLPALVRGCGRG